MMAFPLRINPHKMEETQQILFYSVNIAIVFWDEIEGDFFPL